MNPDIHALIYETPWNLDRGAWRALAASERAGNLDLSDIITPRQEAQIDANGIAHISVSGTLLADGSNLDRMLGNTLYSDLATEFAIASQEAAGIMLKVNSPGGMAVGNVETASVLANVGIPVWAHIEGMGTSAAYAMAAPATRISATPSSMVGSIATILPMVDETEAWSRAGIRDITIASGDLKGATYGPAPTPEQYESLTEMVNDLGAQFSNHVTRFRNVPADAMRGQSFIGERAESVGLIDKTATFENAYKELLSRVA